MGERDKKRIEASYGQINMLFITTESLTVIEY